MKIYDFFISLLYPRKCPFCGKIIDEAILYCSDCAKKLPYIPAEFQPRSFDFVDECHSIFYYRDMVQDSILRYKFHDCAGFCKIYGHFLRKYIDENRISCDIISWVPLSRKRYRKRGYDQARLLADECAVAYSTKSVSLLRKIRDTKAQSGISDASVRKENVKGAYAAEDCADICGKTVLLVDDVVTTGSTVSECSRILKNAGAARVVVLSVAAVVK